MRRNYLAFLLLLFITVSCKNTKDDDREPALTFESGFGDSEERPVGTPFVWPEGLKLLGEPGTDDECDDAVYRQHRVFGHSGSVALCLNFYNNTNHPIRLTLPPGLMFISKRTIAQNGLLLTAVTIEVPAKQQYFAQLLMMCVNPPRSTSSGYEYEAEPIVTDHPALRKLVKMLEGKKCNYEYYGGDIGNNVAMKIGAVLSVAGQDLIYGRPIHEQELIEISRIPNK